MMGNVKVFVQCEQDKLENVLHALGNKGFNLEYRSKTQPGVVIGTIDEDKISELQNTDGVLGIWKDKQFEPLS